MNCVGANNFLNYRADGFIKKSVDLFLNKLEYTVLMTNFHLGLLAPAEENTKKKTSILRELCFARWTDGDRLQLLNN